MPDLPKSWTEQADEYLAGALGQRAPAITHLVGEFDEHPLEGEGRTAILSFDLDPGPGTDNSPTQLSRQHFVAVGQTQPNYFPAYNFDADQGYSLHVGTRFALETGLELVDQTHEPTDARAALQQFITECNPDAPLQSTDLAGLYRCGDQVFGVYKVTLGGECVYCLGADCPPGFYRLNDLPPAVVLRLHLGQLIRIEARRAARRA